MNHDTNLAAGLYSVGALDPVVGVRDFLELLKTLDIRIERLLAGAGTCSRHCISGLDQDVEDRIRIDVGMMSFNGAHNLGALSKTSREIGADDGMTALDFVIDCLAEVVKQACAFRGNRIQSKLGSHYARKISDLK